MRSIHTTNQQDHKNNTPYRVIHKHRTKLGNPIRGIIVPTSIIPIIIISLLALSLCLSSTYTYAESSVSLSVDNNDTVLELTVPTSVNLNLTPSSTNNYNPSGTANLAISAGTNNITGYTLTMSVPSTNLVNSDITLSSSNNPNHIPLDNSNHPIIPTITSTYSGSNFPDNAWGYKISGSNYSPIPSNIELASTSSAGNATTTTLELIAKVNATQPAGTYTTTFNIAATAKQSIFTVNWNANGGTVSPTTSTYRYGSQIGTLPTPTYTGYDFLGWFTQATGGEQISEATTVTADVTYYARWEKVNPFNAAFAGKEKLNGYYKMQDMTASICSSITTPTTTTEDISTQLIDTRDNKIYWVSKLKDGNCWMTQNLDYDLSNSSYQSLSSSTSNVASNTTVTPVSWGYDYNSVYFYEGGDKYLPNGTGSATDITCNSTTNGGENCHYHVGNYYSWKAATAGYGTTSIINADVTSSICPKGWRLPTSNSYTDNYSFGKLTNAYGITNDTNGSSDANLLSSPLWFVRADLARNGSLGGQGRYGYVWSSRAYSDTHNTYYLYFDSTLVNPSKLGTRDFGNSVRCVAE